MRTILFLCFSIYIQALYAQVYPNNETGTFEDMLTPEYYDTPDGGNFRLTLNKFVHFARAIPFQHPLQNASNHIPNYVSHRAFGDGVGPNGTAEHHAAIDMHLGANDTLVHLYAAISGEVHTYKNAAKYRDYLTITKNVFDDHGEILGKMVVIYAHIDLKLDSIDQLQLDGSLVQKGDLISKHLYAETNGGPHLHFEIRYYRNSDEGKEVYYSWSGFSSPSSGPWEYGYWDPNIGYGFANPENHWNASPLEIYNIQESKSYSIFPIPANDYLYIKGPGQEYTIEILDLKGNTRLIKNSIAQNRINIMNLATGCYIVKIKDENGTYTYKMLKEGAF